jgi:hypothetical protein
LLDGPQPIDLTEIVKSPELINRIGNGESVVVHSDVYETPYSHPAVTLNPVVFAAEEYATSQRAAEIAMRRVETLKLELQQAENAAKDAADDRDVKKQVLQKLVSE